MTTLADLLGRHELLTLALVMWLGLLLGRLKLLGVQLGAAGVLFAGLGLSAVLAPYARLGTPAELKELGLVLFVYCVGLSSAAGFFRAFRRRGARWNAIVLASLCAAAVLCVVLGRMLGLDRGQVTGVFCGALTNTPALAAATDRLHDTPFAKQPALGYSAAYPFGVLGSLLLARAFARLHRARLRPAATTSTPPRALLTRNFEVTNPDVVGRPLERLDLRDNIGVVISRIHREGSPTLVPTAGSTLERGDIVVAVGERAALDRALPFFGRSSNSHVEARRDHVDMRRILMSRHDLVGRSLEELDLASRFNAQVTRVRRADVDFLPTETMRLELGDRLRVVAPSKNLAAVSRFFGDSERALAEIDFVALALGLSAGFALALVPLWPGSELRLGIAGPLLVSLVLGRLVRTGNLVWVLPYETNSVLRHFGLLLFLAAVGVGAGSQLSSLLGREGLVLVGLGAVITIVTNVLVLALLSGAGGAEPAEALGGSSGVQTQPATLAAAHELSGGSDEVYVAYAVVYPMAMIGKIILAQLIALTIWL